MDLTDVLTGGGLLTGAVLVAVAVPKLWGPVRRLVAVVDALAGRPPRYDGDPEAQPGLVERLDRIEWHVGNGSRRALRQVVDEVRDEVMALKSGAAEREQEGEDAEADPR